MNYDFVITDFTGELHPPKDPSCREKALTCAEMRAIWTQIKKDLLLLSEKQCPLCPDYFRQLGMHDTALTVEALLANARDPSNATQKVHKRQAECFKVESIMAEKGREASRKYLVRWSGYSPTWEPWRISGDVGDPIETWEPLRSVKNTLVLEEWDNTTVEPATE